MKAADLKLFLATVPDDFTIGWRDVNFGGIHTVIDPADIQVLADEKRVLLNPPYQAYLEDAE